MLVDACPKTETRGSEYQGSHSELSTLNRGAPEVHIENYKSCCTKTAKMGYIRLRTYLHRLPAQMLNMKTTHRRYSLI